MLFETEKKAETFIKFNSEEIEAETGFKPERSYFCIACNGWHITHQKEILNIPSRTERIENLYHKEKEQKALIKTQKRVEFKQSIENIEKYIAILEDSKENKDKCGEILNKAFEELDKVKSVYTYIACQKTKKRKQDIEEKLLLVNRKINNPMKY
jgi:hypothetical protein